MRFAVIDKARCPVRGQAIIEFALIFPILLLIIMGIFDFGYAVFANNMIENAARAGARAAVIKANSDTIIRGRARSVAPGLDLSNDAQIVISPSPNRSYDQPVSVTVRYLYRPITPLIGQVIGGGIQLSATSTMIVEGVIEIH